MLKLKRVLLYSRTADGRRLRIVNAGGVTGLANMLESASDDDTRREAVKALDTISQIGTNSQSLFHTQVTRAEGNRFRASACAHAFRIRMKV